MRNMYTGVIPTKGTYAYFSSVVVANRKWDIYIDKDTNPLFIYWKFVLSSGEWHKANYNLMFLVEDDRLSNNDERRKFLDEFPSHYLQYIEDVSRFFSHSFRSSLLELKECSGGPYFYSSDSLLSPQHIGHLYLQDGERTTKWKVEFNKKDKRIHISKAIPTKTPVHPDWDEIAVGIKQYDYINFVYFIETDEFTVWEEAEFLKYFPLEYVCILKLQAQYLAFKFRHYWDD